jgi:ribosome-associated toxin RatA of RatAB toxin-antitoxin module
MSRLPTFRCEATGAGASGRPGSRLATAAALAIVIAAAQCVTAATIDVHAERKGEAIEIHTTAQLHADAGTAWRVLTAYDRYPDFIPGLRTSRIVSRRGTMVTVEQSGNAWIWIVPVPLDVTFEIVEIPPTGICSHATSGTLNALDSSYALTPSGAGTRLDYRGRISPGFELLGPIELQAVKANVARQFQALADEIERQSAAAGH